MVLIFEMSTERKTEPDEQSGNSVLPVVCKYSIQIYHTNTPFAACILSVYGPLRHIARIFV